MSHPPDERGIRAGVRRLFRLALHRRALAREDVEDEIDFHIAARAERLVAGGMTPIAARADAERLFGDVARARAALGASAANRATRLAWRDRFDTLGDDLRFVVRSLARSRAFTMTVAATFALGIGANAAMFGVIDRLLLRGPRYVEDPGRVRRLYFTAAQEGRGAETSAVFGYVTLATLRDQAGSFDRVAASAPIELTFGSGARAERLRAAHATWELFPLIGVRPALGRFFSADEDRPPRGAHVVVLGYEFWNRAFGGDSTVLGRRIVLNGESYSIIGVAPAGFTGADLLPSHAWIPMSLASPTPDWPTTWSAEWLRIVARLKPDVTWEAASTEATQLYRQNYGGKDAGLRRAQLTLRPLAFTTEGTERPEAAVSRWLTGVACIVLLIACANVTNLLLARATRRRREIAVRLAIGISRWRLVRLLLAESMLLALLGCAVGLLAAYWGGALIRSLLLPNVVWDTSPVNTRVVAIALALSTLTGTIVGLVPALQLGRLDLTQSLKAGSQQTGVQRSRMRYALLFAQAALSVVLLIGAGLFVRSLVSVRALDLGFHPDQVLSAQVAWGPIGSVTPAERIAIRARRKALFETALQRLRATPGVRAAAIAVGTPFGNTFSGVLLRVPGRDTIPELGGGGPYVSAVTPGYFEATEMRLLDGRMFAVSDRADGERLVIVNEPMAATLWPGQRAVGRCLRIFSDSLPCARIVGVVSEVRRFALREPHAMQYYVPLGQEMGIGGAVLLVRPIGEPAAFQSTLRRLLGEIEPDIPYVRIVSMQENLDPLVRPWRMGAILFGIFGAVALIIAAIGLYSVIAYVVAQRTREFGVRVALGASTSRILSLVVLRGFAVTLAGILAGVIVALAAGSFLEPLLFETSAHDPIALLAAVLSLATVAALACVIPARRATSVDPVIALRSD